MIIVRKCTIKVGFSGGVTRNWEKLGLFVY